MKKVMITICFLMLLLVFCSNASANFVCGKVVSQELNPSWLTVKVHYIENSSKFTTCKVSPDNGKYCCDPLNIKDIAWAKGKVVNASIFDLSSGFYSSGVNLTTSGEGFDVFPDLVAEQAISIYSPDKEIYFNSNSVLVNVSIASIFNKIEYVLNSSGNIYNASVCEGCNSSVFSIDNLSEGLNQLFITASNEFTNWKENRNFTIVSELNFSRSLSCKWCDGLDVNNKGQIVNVTVYLNLSSNISGILEDYVPSDWQILGNEEVFPYSDTHNVIRWNVSGKNIKKTYSILPAQNILPRLYTFQSSFGGVFGSEDSVLLSKYKFMRHLLFNQAISKKISDKLVSQTEFVRVSQNEAGVLMINNSIIEEVDIFFKDEHRNVKISVLEKKNTKEAGEFSILTNSNDADINEIWVRLNLDKSKYKNPSFAREKFSDNELENLNFTLISENENKSEYLVKMNGKGNLIIKNNKDE